MKIHKERWGGREGEMGIGKENRKEGGGGKEGGREKWVEEGRVGRKEGDGKEGGRENC